MVDHTADSYSKSCSGFCLFLLHLASFILVVFYVNMFQFWALVIKMLGPGLLTKFLPIIITVLVLLVIVLRFIPRITHGYSMNFIFLGLGLLGAFLALAVPDPHSPIKRIHVAEYIILSFLVRHTLRYRLDGGSLTLFTALVAILFGVHDEMLQGFHSRRYFGWRDIVVNGMAGISGALLGHAVFMSGETRWKKSAGSVRCLNAPGLTIQYLLLLGAVAGLVAALYQQRGGTVSCMTFLPLAGTGLMIIFLNPEIILDSKRHHGLQAVFWLSVTLLLYPLIGNLIGIEFI